MSLQKLYLRIRVFQFKTADKLVEQGGWYKKEKGESFKLNVLIKESFFDAEKHSSFKR